MRAVQNNAVLFPLARIISIAYLNGYEIMSQKIYNKSDVFKNIRRILILTDYSDYEVDRQKRLTVTNFVYRTFSSSKQHYMRTFRNACLLNTQYF